MQNIHEAVLNPWKTLSQRVVYENPWLSVREDRVVRPDGTEGIYGVVEMPPAIGVVACDEEQTVELIGQWRYSLGRFSWEVPTGSCKSGEEPLAAAKRELEEETGLRARSWQHLGTIDNCNAATTEVVHMFLATELELGNKCPDPTEKLVRKRIPWQECVAMVSALPW